ncbi:hypothetical protein ACS0TY_033448 [Phlomoides rotata]
MASVTNSTGFAMNAGTGAHSYVKNSSYQRSALEAANSIIEEEILTKFNIKQLERNCVSIADFGCSTGHNSFAAIQLIIEAINRKFESPAEFHVLFNDLVTNDFNTLFASLPPHRSYYATGVPGDFHGRLLPESSIHFGFSCYALQWLTQVPEAVTDSASPAWNKGAITYIGSSKEVCDAYLDQYSKDIEAFLESRAVEMVGGGLMALLVPGFPQSGGYETDATKLLGSCLNDLAKMGRLSESKIDSFNLGYYFATPQELKGILEKSNSFSIERMEILDNPRRHTWPSADARVSFYRATLERLLTDHFGGDIVEELFQHFKKKLTASPVYLDPANDKTIVVLAVLKRKLD